MIVQKATVSSHTETPKKRELRVLTATAQGVEHWSQYIQHTQILFEVYGKHNDVTNCTYHGTSIITKSMIFFEGQKVQDCSGTV